MSVLFYSFSDSTYIVQFAQYLEPGSTIKNIHVKW